ncbi:hypothetical protein Bbelb_199970 [Branchiostoma belcheri]|nr:hypothetical protein Bbelb_199970 [Branchiostoma belcheri]
MTRRHVYDVKTVAMVLTFATLIVASKEASNKHTCPGVETEASTSTYLPTTASSSELSTEAMSKKQASQGNNMAAGYVINNHQVDISQLSAQVDAQTEETQTINIGSLLHSASLIAGDATARQRFSTSTRADIPLASPLETEVSTTTLLPTTASSSKLFTETSEGPKQTRAELNQQTTQDKQASQGNNMAAGYVVNNHQVDISQLQSAQVDAQTGYSGRLPVRICTTEGGATNSWRAKSYRRNTPTGRSVELDGENSLPQPQ